MKQVITLPLGVKMVWNQLRYQNLCIAPNVVDFKVLEDDSGVSMMDVGTNFLYTLRDGSQTSFHLLHIDKEAHSISFQCIDEGGEAVVIRLKCSLMPNGQQTSVELISVLLPLDDTFDGKLLDEKSMDGTKSDDIKLEELPEETIVQEASVDAPSELTER